jgi:6-pyruvoyltetrahydropterin/6-carboxytetrahydropterin synthase
MNIEIFRSFRFESAHYLPHFPEGHKCRRLHGHSFHLEIGVSGTPDRHTGAIMDFAEIKKRVTPFVEMLDHRLINDVGDQLGNAPHAELLRNPTSENLALWFVQQLKKKISGLSTVVVHETCTSKCVIKLQS